MIGDEKPPQTQNTNQQGMRRQGSNGNFVNQPQNNLNSQLPVPKQPSLNPNAPKINMANNRKSPLLNNQPNQRMGTKDLHAEIPGSKTESSIGFQLWINLPKDLKLCEPEYQEFKAAEIPSYKEEGSIFNKVKS